MPREISDIKTFIEICRRKDASCTYTTKQSNKRRNEERRKHALGQSKWV